MNGLIRSGGNRHEKDDRKSSKNRSNNILGWDNKEKLVFVKERLSKLSKEEEHLNNQLLQLRTSKETINARTQAARSLTSFNGRFDAMNYPALQRDLD